MQSYVVVVDLYAVMIFIALIRRRLLRGRLKVPFRLANLTNHEKTFPT